MPVEYGIAANVINTDGLQNFMDSDVNRRRKDEMTKQQQIPLMILNCGFYAL